MGKVKQEMEALCEVAMMKGHVVIPRIVENGGYDYCLETMVMYCLNVLSDYDVEEKFGDRVHELCNNEQASGFCCNKVMDMSCITILLLDTETLYNPVPNNLSKDVSKNYQSCYVLNATVPEFSEYGDCFFEKRADGCIYRVS